MATGDILSATARAEGWLVDIKLAGLSTGGTYDFGLGASNDPEAGTPKVVFTVVSQGYTNGVLGIRTRTIYGTVSVRKPFSVSGNEFTAEETIDGSDVIVRIALNESIYDSDNTTGGTGPDGASNSGVAPTVTILPGFYTQGGISNNAVTALTVTNNSTLAYPRVIGNFSRAIEYEKVGTSIRVGVAVFHGHAGLHPTTGNGQQVDSVKIIASDTSGHSTTVGVMGATFDASYGHPTDPQGKPVATLEHIADLDTSGFTQGNVCRFDFIAYPFIGNGASVLDTAGTTDGSTAGTGSSAAPSPYYGPRFGICDPAGTYCTSFAVVDAANGVDGTGVVGVGTIDPLNPPLAFATPFAAYNAVRAYNNTNYGRNNCGGSFIYLRDNDGGVNNHVWLGGSPTLGTRPDCLLTVARFPGHSRDNVVIATQSGLRALGELLRVDGIKITATNASGIFDNGSATSYLNLNNCEINSTSTPTVWRVGVWNTTRCLISNFAQGWSNFGGTINSAPALVRGNTLASSATAIGGNQAYTVLGNLKTGTLAHTIGNPMTGLAPNSQNLVIAYNYISASNTGSPMTTGGIGSNPHGTAIVQNVVENRANGGQALKFSADASASICNNTLIFQCVFIGERASMAYNEFGATGYARLNWFVKNNIADDYNIKTDTFGTVVATATRSFAAGTVTVTVTQNGHQYNTADLIYITSATPVAYKTNGVAVTRLSATQFSYQFSAGSDPGAITQMAVAPHPGRIGNWPCVYGVNHSGNIWAETASIGAASVFMQNFTGLKCLPAVTVSEPPTSPTNVIGYLKFVDRKSFNGTTSGTGGGDYHLQSDSPAVGLARDWVLPAGLDGVARRANGAAGSFEYASGGGGGGTLYETEGDDP